MTSSLLPAADVLGLPLPPIWEIKPTQGAPCVSDLLIMAIGGRLNVCGSPVWHGGHCSPTGSSLKGRGPSCSGHNKWSIRWCWPQTSGPLVVVPISAGRQRKLRARNCDACHSPLISPEQHPMGDKNKAGLEWGRVTKARIT